MTSTRRTAVTATAVGLSLALLAACGGDGATEDTATGAAAGGEGGEAVTLTWWHNGNNDPLLSYWQGVADEFEAQNEGVTIEVEPIQNEDLRTRLQVALQSNDPPDVLPQWGGGELAEQVEAGRLMDLTDEIPEAIESLGGSVAGWQTDGRTYGLPYTLGVGGFWYNEALFEQAGITEPPATMDDLLAAVDALKAEGIAPIAVGAADKWPAAWYYYYTATRVCSPETLDTATRELDFSDPCFLEAGELVEELVAAEPFNEGFLATPAQQGATSSAALVGNGRAAMELMGHWHPSVMADLTESGEGLGEDLGWFPFPEVEGGEGNESAMGGGDGFSCAAEAPPICADFLAFVVNEENQRAFGATGAGLPTVVGTQDSVEDENMQQLLTTRDSAEHVQLYLDVAYGPNVGGALNDEVALLFADQSDAQRVVDAITTAASAR